MKNNIAISALKFGGISALISTCGLFVGAMVVILPPMAGVGAVAIIGAALIWAMPELNLISLGSLRYAFVAFLFAEICVPAYYAVQVSGLPWISARRLVALLLITLFFMTVGTAASARARIADVCKAGKLHILCICGYLLVAFISIVTSASAPESVSQSFEIILHWYVPLFACLVVVHSEADVATVFKIITVLSMCVASIGIVEFITQHRITVDIIPRGLLAALMEANPAFADMVNSDPIRNGHYRASSIYTVPLSFGEFAAMIAPISAYFLLHGAKLSERILGIVVMTAAMFSLFVSGSRGGSVAFVISMPIMAVLWIIRYVRSHPRSLVGAISVIVALLGTGSMITAIFMWKRLYNIVFGGGDTVASNDGRFEQWRLAVPHILENPVTGHGLGMGAYVVGYYTPAGTLTIDSYVLTLLVETGAPGLLLFFGAIFFAIYNSVVIYLRDARSSSAALAGPLACGLIAFGFYRIVLSQRENNALFFILLGLAAVLSNRAGERAPRANKSRQLPVGDDSETKLRTSQNDRLGDFHSHS